MNSTSTDATNTVKVTPPTTPLTSTVAPTTTAGATTTKKSSTGNMNPANVTSKGLVKATATPMVKGVSTTTVPVSTTITPTDTQGLDPNATFGYVSYGFIGTSTLLISTSQDKLLELRSVIIK
jgi:hypothetical protein